jgi:hypothetical protein
VFHARLSSAGMALLTVGLAIGTFAPLVTLTPIPANAQSDAANFPDIQDHWAQPFIAPLAEANILTGYLDGSYRPDRPVARDEFAAVLREAFNRNEERQLAAGSVYQDVPADYWAAPAIEEAYEAGFMTGYPGGFFRPQQSVSRVEALVALSQNLNLSPSAPVGRQASRPVSRQANRVNKTQFMMPIAMTTLMQPLMTAPARATTSTPAAPTPKSAESDRAAAPVPDSVLVSNYYTDADQIPQYAVNNVASATQTGIVVSHPEPNVLNPNQPATRGEIAAFIHQALVNQGRLEPLPADQSAANYIVDAQ